MRKKLNILRSSVITVFIIIFISSFFLFLISLYIINNNFGIPVILLIGFGVIIAVIFYIFLDLSFSKNHKMVYIFRIFNENLIKIIIFLSMVFTFFIPPISFSEFIIDWNRIGFFNYIRAFAFLIGLMFLPGACFSNLVFPKMTLPERFKIEPFFLKLTIYPLLSFTILTSATFILDQIGILRDLMAIFLFWIIIILFICDLLVQKFRDNKNFEFKRIEIKVSKNTLLILIVALGIIIIALGVHLSSKYLIPGDSWRGLNYANFIGKPDSSPLDKFYSYSIYWGYFTFSLQALSGIPYVNINAMLFPFLYLFISSIYLCMKALLHKHKEIYATLATVFTVIFSNLFFIFNSNLGGQNYESSSGLIFDGIINFRYKSLALFLLIFSIALFIVITKNHQDLNLNSNIKSEEIKIASIGSFFLLQSFLIYFLPIIPAISFFIIYSLFSNKKQRSLKVLLIYLAFFIILFIPIDIYSYFFFSWKSSTHLSYFLGLSPPLLRYVLIKNALFFYLFLTGFFLIIFFIYKISTRSVLDPYKKNYIKIRLNSKIRFILKLIIFPIFLIEEILFNVSPSRLQRIKDKEYLRFKIGFNEKQKKIRVKKKFNFIKFSIFYSIFFIFLGIEISYKLLIHLQKISINDQNFFLFYLDLFFSNIGFIGILGIILSYFCFKKNRKLYFILLLWGIFIFGLASILIFLRWIQFPFVNPAEIPTEQYFYMVYWFNRIWYYSIIPLSIFASIGLIKLHNYFKSKKIFKIRNKYLKSLPILGFTSILIFSSLSNTIITGMYWNNYPFYTDEEAQIIGWTSNNIPYNSNILLDRFILYHLEDVIFSNNFYIWDESSEALENFNGWKTNYYRDIECNIDLIANLGNHSNFLTIDDQNENGLGSIEIKFNSSQKNGFIEFFIRISDKSKPFWIDIFSFEGNYGIPFSIIYEAFHFYNGTNYQKILDIESDIWYQCQIAFECSDENYLGLDQYHWKITIDGIEYGDFVFWNNISEIGGVKLSSHTASFDYNIFIDAFNLSWARDMDNFEEEIINIYTMIIIDHLNSRNIKYYIISKDSEEYYKNKELIKFFKEKLFEYKNQAIYYANETY